MLEETTLLHLIKAAQEGDTSSRRMLIENNIDFISKSVSSFCHRLIGRQDDEMSVGLIAFNEAIDRYYPEKGRNFYGYARMLIHSRLVDYFRAEKRHLHMLSLEAGADWKDRDDHHPSQSVYETNQAMERFIEEQLVEERAEELKHYRKKLNQLGIRLAELQDSAPKHADSRAVMVKIAAEFVKHPDMVKDLERTGRLPLKKLEKLAGVSRKTLERYRKYLIALIVIFSGEEYVHLKALLDFPDLKRRSYS